MPVSVCVSLNTFLSLPLLYSLCEIPACRIEVGTNAAAMKQLSQVLRCPSVYAESVKNGAVLCVVLAYSLETHSYLAEAGLIENLITAGSIPRNRAGRTQTELALAVLFQ